MLRERTHPDSFDTLARPPAEGEDPMRGLLPEDWFAVGLSLLLLGLAVVVLLAEAAR